MEYGVGEDFQAFRAEVRAFIEAHAPAIPRRAGVRTAQNEVEHKALQEWAARLYDVGYAGADWPEEFGGRGDRSCRMGDVPEPQWTPRARRTVHRDRLDRRVARSKLFALAFGRTAPGAWLDHGSGEAGVHVDRQQRDHLFHRSR